MKSEWKELRLVNIQDENAKCSKCGSELSILEDVVYEREFSMDARTRDELCKCRQCGQRFVLHYDLFDPEGHIYSSTFTGDINDPAYNWHDLLTEEQKKEISVHLAKCPICQERLEEELLTDAWFASIIKELREKRNLRSET